MTDFSSVFHHRTRAMKLRKLFYSATGARVKGLLGK